ncbi:MAG: tetratricopeptide repeat protein [Halodesulfovibrio sp.]
MRRVLVIFWCLWGLFPGAPCKAQSPPAPSFNHSVAVAFGGELGLHVALRVSEAMARIGAMQKASLWLERDKSVQLAKLAYEKTDAEVLRDVQPLAWMIYRPVITEQEKIGKPPNLGVRSTATIVHPARFPDLLKNALLQPKQMLLHRKLLDYEQRILRRFVQVSAAMPGTGAPADSLNKQFEPQFAVIANELHAITLLRDQLPDLQNGLWQHPDVVAAAMRQALELAPDNPMLWYARGTADYQLQRTQDALDAFDRCIDMLPGFAQALHERGTAYLRLHLTTLAVADYDAAIRLQPRNADFFRSRGSAYLVDEDFVPMCRDFYTACSLGACDNYHWATSRGHCQQDTTSTAPTAPTSPAAQ